MKVGIMIEGQEGLTWERWFRLAQTAEDMGFESLCRSDHLTGLGGVSKRPALETWTSLTALALRTKRIRFGAMVSPLTFYHPAIVAEFADEWNVTRVDIAGFTQRRQVLAGHCRAFRRDPDSIARSLMIPCAIGHSPAEVAKRIATIREIFPALPESEAGWHAASFLAGSPER